MDGRSDLYSLGVTAFYAATGRLPFHSDSVSGLLVRHAVSPAPLLEEQNRRLPPRFARAMDKSFGEHPTARFPSADALAEEIGAAMGSTAPVPAPIRAFVGRRVCWQRDCDRADGRRQFARGLGGGVRVQRFCRQLCLCDGGRVYDRPGGGSLRPGHREGARTPRLGLVIAWWGRRLLRDAREQAEESELDPAGRRTQPRELLIATGLGAVKTAAALWLASSDAPGWLAVIGAVGAVVIPTATVRWLWIDFHRGRSVWNRLIAGRRGKLIFRAAGIGSRTPAAVSGGEPTTWRSENQPRSCSMPSQKNTAGIRGCPASASPAAGRCHGCTGTGESRREAAAVAALETIRIDLLRLRAGQVTAGDLTRDLDEVRAIGERIEQRIAAEQEVSQELITPG